MNLPAVIFTLVQSKAAADGGIASISQVIAGLRRHRPVIVTDRHTPRVEKWRQQGVETHVVPQHATEGLAQAPAAVLRSYWRYARALRQIIASSGAKLVHANDPASFQLALPAVVRSGSVKILLNLRDTIDPDRPKPTLRFRSIFAAADHVFYLSQDMAARWAEVASNARRACSITYSIVNPEEFQTSPIDSALKPPIVLLSGIIRPKKGQLEFLRQVAPRLAAQGVEIWLAGDFDPSRNSYMAECAEAAAPLGESVRFLGYRWDLPELIGKSTVVAVPSRHEGLVRSMIEAMSCGRPVVSFDVCSAREVLEEKAPGAGKVIPSGDFDGMTEALLHYCRDSGAAAEAGGAGSQAAAALFDPERVIARYENVYGAVLTARSRT